MHDLADLVAYDSFEMLVQGYESGPDVLGYRRDDLMQRFGRHDHQGGWNGVSLCTGSLDHRNGKPALVEHASGP
jgi:hypothetical protein